MGCSGNELHYGFVNYKKQRTGFSNSQVCYHWKMVSHNEIIPTTKSRLSFLKRFTHSWTILLLKELFSYLWLFFFFLSQDDMLLLSWRAYGRNMNVVQIPWRAIFSTLITQKRFSLVHPELKYEMKAVDLWPRSTNVPGEWKKPTWTIFTQFKVPY